ARSGRCLKIRDSATAEMRLPRQQISRTCMARSARPHPSGYSSGAPPSPNSSTEDRRTATTLSLAIILSHLFGAVDNSERNTLVGNSLRRNQIRGGGKALRVPSSRQKSTTTPAIHGESR